MPTTGLRCHYTSSRWLCCAHLLQQCLPVLFLHHGKTNHFLHHNVDLQLIILLSRGSSPDSFARGACKHYIVEAVIVNVGNSVRMNVYILAFVFILLSLTVHVCCKCKNPEFSSGYGPRLRGLISKLYFMSAVLTSWSYSGVKVGGNCVVKWVKLSHMENGKWRSTGIIRYACHSPGGKLWGPKNMEVISYWVPPTWRVSRRTEEGVRVPETSTFQARLPPLEAGKGVASTQGKPSL